MNLKKAKLIRKTIRKAAEGIANAFEPYELISTDKHVQRSWKGVQKIVNPRSFRGMYLAAKKEVRNS